MELCITREMQRFSAGMVYKYHSKWGWGKMFGLTELFYPIKVTWEQFSRSPALDWASSKLWLRLFRAQGGPYGHWPHLINRGDCRDMVFICLLFSHLKSYGFSCFYSEGKGAWAQFSEVWIKEQMGSIRKSLSDHSYPRTAKRLCWPKRHILCFHPSPPKWIN